MVPRVYFLTKDLEMLLEAKGYTSLQFSRCWQTAGEFELHISDCDAVQPILNRAKYITLDGDRSRCGIIENILHRETAQKEIVVKGYTCNRLLRRRVNLRSGDDAVAKLNFGYDPVPMQTKEGEELEEVPAETVLKTYVSRHMTNPEDEKRRMENLTVAADQKRGKKMMWIADNGTQLDDTMHDVGEFAEMGFEIGIDVKRKKMIFEVIPGVDRSRAQKERRAVVFSKVNQNIQRVDLEQGEGDYRNTGYAAGEELDTGLRNMIAVSNETDIPAGIERKEVYLDCGNLSVAESETSISLGTEARQKMSAYKKIESISCDAVALGPYEYLRDFDLGDMVSVDIEEFGMTIEKRITEIKEIYQPNSIKIEPVFGTPKNAKINLVRKIRNLVVG